MKALFLYSESGSSLLNGDGVEWTTFLHQPTGDKLNTLACDYLIKANVMPCHPI